MVPYGMGQPSSCSQDLSESEYSPPTRGGSPMDYEIDIPQPLPPYLDPPAATFPSSRPCQPTNVIYEGSGRGRGVPVDPPTSPWPGIYLPLKACARACGNSVATNESSEICLSCRGVKKCAGKCPNTLPSSEPVELCPSCRILKPCGTKGCPSMMLSSHAWEFCDLCTRSCASGCGAPVVKRTFCERCEHGALRQSMGIANKFGGSPEIVMEYERGDDEADEI